MYLDDPDVERKNEVKKYEEVLERGGNWGEYQGHHGHAQEHVLGSCKNCKGEGVFEHVQLHMHLQEWREGAPPCAGVDEAVAPKIRHEDRLPQASFASKDG